jgi:glycosyltransferase involved in cell wall biosynthesis
MKEAAMRVSTENSAEVLFVAPRFHTNYIGWLHGLSKLGISCKMLVQTVGKSENHSFLKPEKIDPSVDYFRISILDAFKFDKYFILFNKINKMKPKLIIFRFELNLTSFFFLVNILLSRTQCLIYLQWPLCGANFPRRALRIFFTAFLKVSTITPVLSRKDSWIGQGTIENKSHGSFFIPFGMPIRDSNSAITSKALDMGSVRFLTVGKFQQRKNHIETIQYLMSNENFRSSGATFEIIGEVSNLEHFMVLDEIKTYVLENRLENKILISLNINHYEVLKKIEESNIFILMSDSEPASISNLEAMSFGKPVIIQSGNGTANYLNNEYGGFIISSPEEFDQRVNYIFDHPEFMIRCHVENLLTVKELLDPELVAKKLLACARYKIDS